MQKLYEGKAKALYQSSEKHELLVVYSDQATAFNGEKKAIIEGKGALNNQITALIFTYLENQGIPTQFIRQVSTTQQIVKKLTMLPVEVVVRNRAAGSICKRLGIKEGIQFPYPTVEFYYKDDTLGDPFVNSSQLAVLNILTESEYQQLTQLALEINDKLVALFQQIDMILVDMKFEFGKTIQGDILLADEISPDTCRLWQTQTLKKLDKDNFRQGSGDIIPVYTEVLEKLKQLLG